MPARQPEGPGLLPSHRGRHRKAHQSAAGGDQAGEKQDSPRRTQRTRRREAKGRQDERVIDSSVVVISLNFLSVLGDLGGEIPQCRLAMCSFRMHRSITTIIPATRAFSAASAGTTPSCIQIAGTPSRIASSTTSGTNSERRNTFTMSIFSGTSDNVG